MRQGDPLCERPGSQGGAGGDDSRNFPDELCDYGVPVSDLIAGLISHNAEYVNVPGVFCLLHFLVLSLVTHFYLRHKSVVFLLKAIT